MTELRRILLPVLLLLAGGPQAPRGTARAGFARPRRRSSTRRPLLQLPWQSRSERKRRQFFYFYFSKNSFFFFLQFCFFFPSKKTFFPKKKKKSRSAFLHPESSGTDKGTALEEAPLSFLSLSLPLSPHSRRSLSWSVDWLALTPLLLPPSAAAAAPAPPPRRTALLAALTIAAIQ